MKSENSPHFYGDSNYNIIPKKHFPYTTLAAASSQLHIRPQRMSRLLRILQVPIIKIGTLVLLPPEAMVSIRHALRTNQVKRGRKADAT